MLINCKQCLRIICNLTYDKLDVNQCNKLFGNMYNFWLTLKHGFYSAIYKSILKHLINTKTFCNQFCVNK